MAERQLVASTSAAVPAALLQAAAAASGFDAATALVATCAPTAASLPGAPFDAVCVLSPAGEVRAGTVAWAVKMLVKKGRLSLLQPAAQGSARSAALFNGLVGLDSREVDLLGARFALTAGAAPAVEVGAKSAIRLSGAPAAAPAVWKIDAAEDSELIDEDALLTEDDLKPVAPPAQAGCPPTKKACANCSCGRAEAEAAGVKVELTQDMLENPQSACGSCGMGDAFRCASCPYRGLPSFKPGSRIELPQDFLVADA